MGGGEDHFFLNRVAGQDDGAGNEEGILGARASKRVAVDGIPIFIPCFNFPRVGVDGGEEHILATVPPSNVRHGHPLRQKDFSVSASPTELGAMGGEVVVQWGAPALHEALWIGAFLAGDNVTLTAPIKFLNPQPWTLDPEPWILNPEP